MTAAPDLNRPAESLEYERQLIAQVVKDGRVRPEIAAGMTVRADRIDRELDRRHAA